MTSTELLRTEHHDLSRVLAPLLPFLQPRSSVHRELPSMLRRFDSELPSAFPRRVPQMPQLGWKAPAPYAGVRSTLQCSLLRIGVRPPPRACRLTMPPLAPSK